MTTKQMIEMIEQHHPHLGETEILLLINRAKDDFCAKTDIVKDTYTSVTVANQRYHTLDNRILRIQSVWLNDVKIPMLNGKPIIDDDTDEGG
tara:strand:+ start:1128 stop:1403 length:276 start_codon:yes stop_codon:yes gene_type:complete